ncbi:MAG: hypothetical protein KAU35_01335 [candidate division Zixibacteria bacterium]|nr:hypothetical protein [candidate division Zixibacteria bacterium]
MPAEIDERIAKCQKILDGDPNSQIFAALAEAYRKKGNLEKAFRICQNGLKINSTYGSAHVVMAKINLDRGLYDWAEAEAGKAAEIDGWTRATELLLAEIHIYKGEFSPAIRLLKRLHAGDPDNSQITKLLDIARQLPLQQAQAMGEATFVERPDTGEPAGGDQQVKSVIPPAAASASQILEQSITIRGIDGALFVNCEGLMVESQWTMQMDANACGAIVGDIGEMLNRELVRSCFGGVHTILIETGDLIFYVVRGTEGMFLFVANTSTNLGALRMKLEGLLSKHLQQGTEG